MLLGCLMTYDYDARVSIRSVIASFLILTAQLRLLATSQTLLRCIYNYILSRTGHERRAVIHIVNWMLVTDNVANGRINP